MSKAVTEVAVGAAAIGMAIAMPGIGAGLAWMTLGMQNAIIGSLASIGASQVFAGVSDAIGRNQGGLAIGVTTPIGPWAYVYGTQKVGGVEIFRESNNNTGVSGSTSADKQLHRIYCLAAHPCEIGSDWQLRIDGKQVLVRQDTHAPTDYVSYSPTQLQHNITSISRTNGVVTMTLDGGMSPETDGTTLQVRSVADRTFNGTWIVTQANPTDLTTWTFVCGGPDATTSGGNARTTYSDYKDKIRVSFLDGNHTSTFPTLLAAGTTWTANDLCLGRTLAYVQMGYDDTVFPSSIPNVSFVIKGKSDILDPRSGTRGWTNNAALCIADFLSLPPTKGGFGLTIGTDIPTAALIAAANVCDEQVLLNAGGTIKRYTCDTFFMLNSPRGAILKDMLSSCAGRISYQGGTYMIQPGAWVTPTLQLTDADLVGPIKWRPRHSIRDTANGVKGTFISPENAYQQADIPPYMQDADHGYVSDPWLAEDNGERIFAEANFPCTDSSATAQRLAKIALLRTRYQGRGTIRVNLKGYQAVALDIIQITHPHYTWLNKNFEVLASRFGIDKSGDAPLPYVELDIAETDSSIYDWNPIEQLTPQDYKQPNNVGVRICMPPEDVTGYSGPGATINGFTYPSTITTGADGRIQNSIYIHWTQPNDANVVFGGHLEAQWQMVGTTTWSGLAKVDASADHLWIPNVSDGQQYNVQVRAVNTAGVPSDWVFCGPITVSNQLSSISYSGIELGPPGTLMAQGLADGTAQITVLPFTGTIGALSADFTPSPNTISGLNQSQLYYVYFVRSTFTDGTIDPIATQTPSDFEGQTGYFLIGSIVTPSYTPRYQPSRFSDVGNSSTSNAQAAYDNDVTTYAVVVATWWSTATGTPSGPVFAYHSVTGDCVWSGFPAITTTADTTLHVITSAAASTATAWSCAVSVKIGGTTTTLISFSAASAESDYTMTIPAGTDLSTISVEATANITADSSPGSGWAKMQGFEIYVS
jgi:hypothetical protein